MLSTKMHSFQVFPLLTLILLTTLIEAQEYMKPGCNDTCGHVSILYPFGIGRNCSANKWYTIDCNSSTPYLSALNNARVLDIGLSTVTVNMPVIKADCENPVQNINLDISTNHGKSPFLFYGLLNVVMVEGCGNAAIMENGNIVSGCSTTCGKDTVRNLYNCFGVDCCQATIPHDLRSFTFNLTGLEREAGNGTCGSAFLVDRRYLESYSTRSNFEDKSVVPISLSWNETFNFNLTRCSNTCGEVLIPYPFGIERNCSWSDWFSVVCNSSTPYLPAFNNLEVLDVSLEEKKITVNVPMISDCKNPDQNNNSLALISRSPFRFSSLFNVLVVEGCGNADIRDDQNYVTSCSATCDNDTVSDRNNCFGIGCCQTTISHDFKSFTFNLTGMERQARNGRCGSAFLVDKKSFIQNRLSSRSIVNDHTFVPISLLWTSQYGDENEDPECSACKDDGGFCHYESDLLSKVTCFHFRNSKTSLGAILGVSISMGLLSLTLISYALYKIIKKSKAKRSKQRFFKRNGGLLLKQQEATNIGLVDKTILFTSNELEKATDYFNENRILGRGGQGTVYKGMLADGRIVAIKKSKVVDESQLEQFINEVVILSQVNHRHVVKLLGCCLETEVPILVSEFISNGTLYDLIQDENGEFPISLNMRLQIAREVAGVISYLHSATSIPIYHRDVKTTNILLDEKYRAKVSDFGTSRFVSFDQTHLTTLVKGTFGYLDPEYFQSSQFTEKSDVYSFGVVLLELFTREKPISLTRFGENRSLAAHFLLAMEEGRVMSVFDAIVVKEGSRTELMAVANLAMRCLNFSGKNRPTMKEVAIELEGIKLSHVPSTDQTNFGHMKQFKEVPLTYGESISTSMTFDDNPSR